ncbi:hypothetical protein [Myroides sp.]|uniref:hypothetical protein n=1 Tax=Myroides sp. TaxID=1874736 RepID=UPI003F409852
MKQNKVTSNDHKHTPQQLRIPELKDNQRMDEPRSILEVLQPVKDSEEEDLNE